MINIESVSCSMHVSQLKQLTLLLTSTGLLIMIKHMKNGLKTDYILLWWNHAACGLLDQIIA